ncbi:MAG: PQQ-dependent sugar dehydrogenase, partial [Bryobacteraceae bacterium]
MSILRAGVVCLALSLPAQEIRMTRIASGIVLPTDIQNAGDGSGRLFFVQQNGIVRLFRDGVLAAAPFLDIRARTRGEGESGLLGMAFPPGFARSQRFYVNYTDLAGDTIVAQYRVSSNPDVADAASEVVLLKIDQPYDNHNGGGLRFGPDGFL